MTSKRMSLKLEITDGHVCCAHCRKSICSTEKIWKEHSALSETPAADLPGQGLGIGLDVMIRQFSCKQCGALLDTEVALSGDPFLNDRLFS
ncbi:MULTISPECIES: hypothetical protein [unclassified Beijerinckia]|uniref:hypothetical protein n=1 Tax=unclassified Beijerinckia TaxID=2638183 RepID=UPI000B82FA25|nr:MULTISPECIES: hypothetical protein [unclassified Beijerinckia]MDH7799221.1 acetone carboxylase gamma subunit [Beijerinckia sp. GAS462]